MLQSLPRIHQPNGALAIVKQATRTELIPPPRYMSLNNTFTVKRNRVVPADTASMEFKALYKGYLATRTVVACEAASELPMLMNAENTELRAAATCVIPPDGSLPARAVAVTLLIHGSGANECNYGRVHLDALAHLASSPLAPDTGNKRLTAEMVRMTVLAGPDAAWFAAQVEAECLHSASDHTSGVVEMCVRWPVPGGTGMLRTEFKTLSMASTPDKTLEQIQNSFISMKMAFNVPFGDDIVTRHPNVPNDAWAHSVHNASTTFASLMEGAPGIYKSPALVHASEQLDIDNTGIFVRICPRKQYDHASKEWKDIAMHDAVCRQDTFHGFLVGNSAYNRDIAHLCKQYERIGLPMPTEATRHMHLHTVAVQATGFPLEHRVSLYAVYINAGGWKPGTSIAAPGSWIWRFDPAMVSLDTVLQSFHVVPCSRDSLLPLDRRLEKSFGDFFNRAFQLYRSIFGDRPTSKCGDDFEQLPLTLPARPPSADPERDAQERHALSAFGLDASSRRMVVGDAYATLKSQNAPQAMTDFMLKATLQYGLNTSVVDAMSRAGDAIGVQERRAVLEVKDKQVDRLKRLADAAFGLENKCLKTLTPAVTIEAARIQAMLRAAGRRKGDDIQIPSSSKATMSDYSALVETIGRCITHTPVDGKCLQHAAHTAREQHKKSAANCFGSAVCVLRSSRHTLPSSVFVLGQKEKEDGTVSFNRVLPSGAFEASTPGAVMDSPVSSVFLLKVQQNGAMRVTCTMTN